MKKILKVIFFSFSITLLTISHNELSNGATVPLSWSEGFDNVSSLTQSGWFTTNKSEPLGPSNWSQGNFNNLFDCYQGASKNSFISVDYYSTRDEGTISNWLITPEMILTNGSQFSFYTRQASMESYADGLQVRMSTNGTSVEVGQNSMSVGDFSTLLLEINPSLQSGVYPNTWTLYTVTINGLSAPTAGRLAFRYFVTNGGPDGEHSDCIGIDSVFYVARAEVKTNVNIIGAGTASEPTTFDIGSNASVVATANNGYTFVNWTDKNNNVVSSNPTYNFTVTNPAELTANFVRDTGDLTVNINPNAANIDGAKWSLDGGQSWNSIGSQSLPTGVYDITFKDIEGWDTPSTISDVQLDKDENKVIDANYIRKSYIVNIKTETGYELQPLTNSTSPVDYNGSYSFKVKLAASHSNSNIVVKANGNVLSATNGVYRINNIKKTQNIEVSGLQINTYAINLPSGTGYSLLPESGSKSPVSYGGSYQFKVQLASAYSNSVITVKSNGQTLTAVNGLYTIKNIRENQSITITGVQINKYNVKALNGTGYSIIPQKGSTSSVTYGGNYQFKVPLASSYSNSKITVKVNGKILTAVNGIYTIKNITTNQTITVAGVQINKYAVTAIKGTGYSILPQKGSISPISYGGNYQFKVQLASSYSKSKITVKVNGKKVTAVNGIYNIKNITTNQTITVTGVRINKK